MPNTNTLTFIIVQHLSPDFNSMMSELLAHNTDIPIEVAKNKMALQPGVIYLIPATFEATITDNCFVLSQIDRASVRTPINTLFESLAKNYKQLAIGIILSGTGSDGTLGMKSISKNNGLTIAQTPSEAKFTDMPTKALATKEINYVLSVSEIPNVILEYVEHPGDFNKSVKQIEPINESEYSDIFHLLNTQFHSNFGVYKIGTVSRRIQRRMQLLGIERLSDYTKYLTENTEGLKTLYQYLLIGVTEFFRDMDAFTILETDVIPELFNRTKKDQTDIRIWITACSTGEEAYSIAILCKKYADTHNLPFSVKIFASDVFPYFIQKAKKGRYSAQEVTKVPVDILNKYFVKYTDYYEVIPEIKNQILFTNHNLLNDPPFTKLDLICCRNFLIYIKPQEQKRVLDILRFGLNVGGFLFLGPSEGLASLRLDLITINQTWKIFKKTKPSEYPQISTTLFHKSFHIDQPLAAPNLNPSGSLPLFAYNAILQEVVSAGFIIDTSYIVLHSIGKARDLIMLPEGTPTLILPKIIIDELKVALIAALHQAKIKLIPVVYDHIMLPLYNGKEQSIKMSVHPICDKNHTIAYYWIRLDPVKLKKQPKITISGSQKNTHHDEIIIALEGELVEARVLLQSSLENMETVNEEMQSTNEELMASNEKLQSTNEELQSVNEELNIVNLERSKKINEVIQAKDDIDNFKDINDKWGHSFGDEVICAVANKLNNCSRTVDLLARLSGDEFAILLEDMSSKQEILDIAKRYLTMFSEPLQIDNTTIQATLRIGIALYPEHGATAQAILQHADEAMYLAKKQGKNQIVLS